jgi:acyl carrier protein
METKVAEEVRQRFAGIMSLDAAALDMDARLVDTYGVDSLNALRLVSELEVALDVDIPEEELVSIQTLNDVVRLCHTHARSEAGGGQQSP